MNPIFQSRRERDRICDEFEQQWVTEDSIQIESFLSGKTEDLGLETINELILVEIDLRHANGMNPDRSEYLERFPDLQEAIDTAFSRIEKLNQTQILSNESVNGEESKLTTRPATVIPGQVGKYKIIRLLGTGAFGVVYKAEDVESGETFALKFPKQEVLDSLNEFNLLRNEAEVARHLDHPAIARSFGLHDEDGFLFIVQQFVSGRPLNEIELTDVRQIANVIAQIADGLAHAHEHELIHRDLKPANIMVDSIGNPFVVDFGLAIRESAQRRLRGQRCGTPPYMSPEQVMGLTHQLDGRCDIWSLGVTLYELLTGKRPFGGDDRDEVFEEIRFRNEKPLRMVRPDLDQELQRICLKCLAKPIRDRYNTATELADDLRSWLENEDKWQAKSYVPLIPRGLRSYGPQDSDAFMQLLPGLRDRHGIPESIQFWKSQLESVEETQLDPSFSVGVIMGPSGSGKSSFVRAGLIPSLDPNLVQTVYVEATGEHTESRLLSKLKQLAPSAPDDSSLAELLDGLKEGVWAETEEGLGDRGKGAASSAPSRTLIVIDQFEQWILNDANLNAGSGLVEGLQHCDGEQLHCVLLIRDEFWLGTSRLLETLGVNWVERENIQRLDLFEKDHAQDVLFQIGRALSKFPEEKAQLSQAQHRFVESVVECLAKDSKVISVQLALFGEMLKNREWTTKSLDEIGGVDGVGEIYLEDLFGRKAFKAQPSGTVESAKKVLESLLPKSNLNIRGHMVSGCELRRQLDFDEDQFDEITTWLDQDLRLITRTNPEISDSNLDSALASPGLSNLEDDYFQLTHDYLVPSLRRWLSRKKRETWRGRAELKLDEMASQWSQSPSDRLLPGALDTLSIKLAVSGRRPFGTSKSKFLKRATLFHSLRLMAVGILAAIIGIGVWNIYLRSAQQAAEVIAKDYFGKIPNDANFADIKEMDYFVRPLLNKNLLQSPLRAALALNEIDGATKRNCDLIVENVLKVKSSMEFGFVLERLDEYPDLALNSFHEFKRADESKTDQAKILAGMLYLGDTSETKAVFRCEEQDRTLQTLVSEQIGLLWPASQAVSKMTRLVNETEDVDLLYGLLVAADGLQLDQSVEAHVGFLDLLKNELVTHPDPGIYSISKHLVRKWTQYSEPVFDSEPDFPTGKGWLQIQLVPGIDLTFVRIPQGEEFVRSVNSEGTEHQKEFYPPTRVALKNDVWISTTEITFSQFLVWADKDGSQDSKKLLKRLEEGWNIEAFQKKSGPIYGISYKEAKRFVAWLNSKLAPKGLVIDIPTSDEWECAARAGSMTWFPFGDHDCEHLLDRYASVKVAHKKEQSFETPMSRLPNRFGLHDMIGNVDEFCRQTKRENDIRDDIKEYCVVRASEFCCPGYVLLRSENITYLPIGIRLVLREAKAGDEK